MKNFKTLCFGLFLSILICSCANEEYSGDAQLEESALKIGKIVNGELFLDNESKLKSDWEQKLEKEGMDVQLFNFKIVEGSKNKTEGSRTILTAQSTDLTIKTAIELEERNGEYFQNLPAGTVTCKGCTVGCDPMKIILNWICTACVPAIPNNCEKTVTVEIDGF